jgi:DNA-binding HxlR family transcriptional regulator
VQARRAAPARSGAVGRSGGAASRYPIADLMDLLGRRWTLRVLWDLRDGPLRFGDLQADEISTSVLTARLRELADARLVERRPDRTYALTARGEELKDLLLPLNDFAKRTRR